MTKVRIVFDRSDRLFKIKYFMVKDGVLREDIPYVTVKKFAPRPEEFKSILQLIEERNLQIYNQDPLLNFLNGKNAIIQIIKLYELYKATIAKLDECLPCSEEEELWSTRKVWIEDQIEAIVGIMYYDYPDELIEELECLANQALYDNDEDWKDYLNSF